MTQSSKRLSADSLLELFSQNYNIAVLTGGYDHPYPFIIRCLDDATLTEQIQEIELITNSQIWAVKRNQGGEIWLASHYQRVTNDTSRPTIKIFGSVDHKSFMPPSTYKGQTYTWYRRDGDRPPVVDIDKLTWLSLKRETEPEPRESPRKQIARDHWDKVRNEIEANLRAEYEINGTDIKEQTLQQEVNSLLSERKQEAASRITTTPPPYTDYIIAYATHRKLLISSDSIDGASKLAVFIGLLRRIQIEQDSSGETWQKPFRATNREIAEMVGINKDTVSRTLQWYCDNQYLTKISDAYEGGKFKFTNKVISGGRRYLKNLSQNNTLSTHIINYTILKHVLSELPLHLLYPQALSIYGALLYTILKRSQPQTLTIQVFIDVLELSRSAVSKHLSQLEAKGIIDVHTGKRNQKFYALKTGHEAELEKLEKLASVEYERKRAMHEQEREVFLVNKLKRNLQR